MAHYAKLDINGKVLSVNRINDIDNKNEQGIEDESIGILFLQNIHGWASWKKCSYNTIAGKYYNSDGSLGDQSKVFRKNYPAVGYTYDENRDAFIPAKNYPSWILDEEKCIWNAPISKPSENLEDRYMWNETNLSWEKY
jgi:hypothetical protein